jgi:flavin reductase (DIM6/NTAB) family NADH-FMN oxidoreductase RutF
MFFGTRSGRDVDKLVEAGCPTEPACGIDSVLLSDAVANFECRLVSETEAGDHIVVIGEIVCSHVNEKPLNRLYSVGKGHKLGPGKRGHSTF